MHFGYLSTISTITIGDNKWLLNADYIAECHHKGRALNIRVRRGFKTDFCSVPRLPFAYLLFAGIGHHAGLLHDALYSNYSGVIIKFKDNLESFEPSRAWADKMFYNALKNAKIGIVRRTLMYIAVRLVGQYYYKTDTQKDHFLQRESDC
jgi:hypothetical protein